MAQNFLTNGKPLCTLLLLVSPRKWLIIPSAGDGANSIGNMQMSGSHVNDYRLKAVALRVGRLKATAARGWFTGSPAALPKVGGSVSFRVSLMPAGLTAESRLSRAIRLGDMVTAIPFPRGVIRVHQVLDNLHLTSTSQKVWEWERLNIHYTASH